MKRILKNLKRFILACCMAFAGSLAAFPQGGGLLQGTYLTRDCNTEYDGSKIKVTYTFQNDSLYIDTYPSGCGIACMSLEKEDGINRYKATEVMYDPIEPEVAPRSIVYHLEFIPCKWDKNSYAVYRDCGVVDIIEKIP